MNLKRIIITADDFGWDGDTVAATITLLDKNYLSGASIMLGVPGTNDAIAYARMRHDKCFGLHVVLGGDGIERPISDPSDIKSLVDASGYFLQSNEIRKRALLGRLCETSLIKEIRSQIIYILDHGIRPQYLDSHGHLHKFPIIMSAFKAAADEFGIKRVRMSQNIKVPINSPSWFLSPYWNKKIRKQFQTTDYFFMPTSKFEDGWARWLAEYRWKGILELGVHPGTNAEYRRKELLQLEHFHELMLGSDTEQITWRDI
ncbi:ChbG/HpnK family deacetylase [Planktomarina temperata]|nr:ChbG/HpnK family deacetylase [Planktomarina temperata]